MEYEQIGLVKAVERIIELSNDFRNHLISNSTFEQEVHRTIAAVNNSVLTSAASGKARFFPKRKWS